MTGRNFRDYHRLLDEQAEQLFAMTDEIAKRARKLGGTTLHSIGEIARNQRLKDKDLALILPMAMLAEVRNDNRALAMLPPPASAKTSSTK